MTQLDNSWQLLISSKLNNVLSDFCAKDIFQLKVQNLENVESFSFLAKYRRGGGGGVGPLSG